MADALGTFMLEELNPPRGRGAKSFKAVMDGPPVPTGGYGGWEKVARPRRKSLTEWVGRDPMSIEITFLLDGQLYSLTGREVESSCRDLESLSGVEGYDPEPALCRLSSVPAPLMPHGQHRARHVKWFIETLSWDKELIQYNRAGNRERAGGTILVTQHVRDEKLSAVADRKSRRSRAGSGRGSKRKTYTVRAGDNLAKIAARRDVYGDPKKWPVIAKANRIRDPKNLKVGRVLRIP